MGCCLPRHGLEPLNNKKQPKIIELILRAKNVQNLIKSIWPSDIVFTKILTFHIFIILLLTFSFFVPLSQWAALNIQQCIFPQKQPPIMVSKSSNIAVLQFCLTNHFHIRLQNISSGLVWSHPVSACITKQVEDWPTPALIRKTSFEFSVSGSIKNTRENFCLKWTENCWDSCIFNNKMLWLGKQFTLPRHISKEIYIEYKLTLPYYSYWIFNIWSAAPIFTDIWILLTNLQRLYDLQRNFASNIQEEMLF